MAGYVLRRILGALPTLFIIVTLTFFMMHAAPGGPFDSQRRLPPEVEHNIKAAYNLDKPVYEQYLIYLDRLGLSAMALALLLGSLAGIWAALRQNHWQDYSVMTLAMVGITIPTFVTAPILTLIFGVYGVTLF